jgi:broad specificity phosphatase PhoE
MSTLVFVRHGQASLFADDYDNLSAVGKRQSQELGSFLNRRRVPFDELYVGPRRRHRQTVIRAQERCSTLPAAEEIPEFDEHHVDQLVSNHLDALCEQFPHLVELRVRLREAAAPIDRQRAFARLFEAVSILWVNGTCPLFGIESWQEFKERVSVGIDRIIRQTGSNRRVMVSTSAGTIVAAVHRALQCPDEVALGLGWRIWNCSVTGFAFSGDRFTLDRFNTMSHLEDPSLWTYR